MLLGTRPIGVPVIIGSQPPGAGLTELGVGNIRCSSTSDLVLGAKGLPMTQSLGFEEFLEWLAHISRPPSGHHPVLIHKVVLEAIKDGHEGLLSHRVKVLRIFLVALHALLQVTARRPCAASALPDFLPKAHFLLHLLDGFLVLLVEQKPAVSATEGQKWIQHEANWARNLGGLNLGVKREGFYAPVGVLGHASSLG